MNLEIDMLSEQRHRTGESIETKPIRYCQGLGVGEMGSDY